MSSSWIAPKIWSWGFQCPACYTKSVCKRAGAGWQRGHKAVAQGGARAGHCPGSGRHRESANWVSRGRDPPQREQAHHWYQICDLIEEASSKAKNGSDLQWIWSLGMAKFKGNAGAAWQDSSGKCPVPGEPAPPHILSPLHLLPGLCRDKGLHGPELWNKLLRRTPALAQEGTFPGSTFPRHTRRLGCAFHTSGGWNWCQLRGNVLPFVGCHSWFPNFLGCLQLAGEAGAARQLDPKKPSLLLYYLAQSIITVLGSCITFRSVLCIVYYRENSAFWILPIWLGIMDFRWRNSEWGWGTPPRQVQIPKT